ncbi:aminopeptidase [Fictibacillus macauensis ZFHKF-1]|uniref:Aminopeptidase n=1 Tax=Fictibacillus macauensis ZFHKF-1 TaxID=1196324 RepID=I8AF80_9BACL|nr:aminopeptidase [Fictibacillus macauensis]EIT84287.1 aminopeptidase [Fictibacillus macauensis ZFHKF-1]
MNQSLESYANVILHVGISLQKGQLLFIKASVETVPFVRLLVAKAYERGARDVIVRWNDETIHQLYVSYADRERLATFSPYDVQEREALAGMGCAFLSLVSDGPLPLEQVSHERLMLFHQAKAQALFRYSQYIQQDQVSWCVAAAATPAWAAAVFPQLPSEQQVQALWEAIFAAVRLNCSDPVRAWGEHIATLTARCEHLNQRNFRSLHFKGPGTDLTVKLPATHRWIGAENTRQDGHTFVSNLPVEELYTAPEKFGVNGVVTSTKPLVYGGVVIPSFTLHIQEGRVITVEAAEGRTILEELLRIDEGAAYFGEVALVDQASPLAQRNLLFYQTLFDENASCHLALGGAYPTCVTQGKEALNTSSAHVDFMIGSDELSVTGTRLTGEVETILKQGRWVSS